MSSDVLLCVAVGSVTVLGSAVVFVTVVLRCGVLRCVACL